MKNICSGLLIITLSLGQVCSAYDAEGGYPKNEIITEGKISSQEKNGDCLPELNKNSNKNKKENKNYNKKTNNINVDPTVSSIALGSAILGATGIYKYTKSKKQNKSMRDSRKGWFSEKYDALKAALNSTYYYTKDCTSEEYDEGKIRFEEADTKTKVAARAGSVATLMTLFVSMYFCCCRCCGCCKVSATTGSGA